MERPDNLASKVDSWEAFALGELANLGPFSQVHLAPKIALNLLSTALVTYLPLQEDELILALIDGGSGKPDGCCALTSRRIYWLTEDDAGDGSPNATLSARARGRQRRWVCHAVHYGALPTTIVQSRSVGPTATLDLGSGRLLALKGDDPRLTTALVHYLETMGAAARTGMMPSLRQRDPELAARVERVLPAVARMSDQARTLNRDLVAFRRRLHSTTPRVFVTPTIVLACAAAFVCMVGSGVTPFWPSAPDLVAWGANDGARVILRQEYWRLITSVFVHGGLLHLAVNMWSLVAIGTLVERLYGNLAFAALYLAAGIGGAIASIAVSPARVSVGASGAIMGVLGALLAFLITHRRAIPATVLRPLRGNAVTIVVFMGILGAVVPNIDQAAHLGGLATGFVGGFLLTRPWPVVPSRWIVVRRIAMSALIAGGLAVASVTVARRGEAMVTIIGRARDFQAQIRPAVEEIRAIGALIPTPSALKEVREIPSARETTDRNLQRLIERGNANVLRLRRTTTPDPRLKEAMVDTVMRAQINQLARLRSARRYLETGVADDGPDPDESD
jgi:rhomboid protease GluP